MSGNAGEARGLRGAIPAGDTRFRQASLVTGAETIWSKVARLWSALPLPQRRGSFHPVCHHRRPIFSEQMARQTHAEDTHAATQNGCFALTARMVSKYCLYVQYLLTGSG
jgi:hypothetical protein